jgi:hypothetical protein
MSRMVELRKAYVRIPKSQASPGGRNGIKRLKGAAEEAAASQWKKGLMAKADRDQNSSIPTSTKLVMPTVDHKATVTTAHSRTGSFAGKQRGVGRHLDRDQNSSPGSQKVATPSLRDINGRFADQAVGVKVFHPTFSTSSRPPRNNKVQRWTRGGDAASRPWVAKSDDRKGLIESVDLAPIARAAGARVGRRIPA